jgi:hypothetical protein
MTGTELPEYRRSSTHLTDKTAKALGVEVPATVLAQAGEAFE